MTAVEEKRTSAGERFAQRRGRRTKALADLAHPGRASPFRLHSSRDDVVSNRPAGHFRRHWVRFPWQLGMADASGYMTNLAGGSSRTDSEM